jgi:hypothetical protein
MKALWNGIGIAVLLLFLTIHVSQAAAPIIKLDLAKTPAPDLGPDIIYTGAALATPPDGNNLTTGLQDTAFVFGDFLYPWAQAFAVSNTGSYSLHNLITNGPATTVAVPGGTLVFQPMMNGDFQLYDSGNVKLLDVDLTTSSTLLTGTLNSPTGGLITVTNATVVGGTFAPLIVSNSISFSISLSNILSGGTTGALVLGGGNILQPFTASATKEIGANPTPLGSPEPTSAVLLALGSLCGATIRRRN